MPHGFIDAAIGLEQLGGLHEDWPIGPLWLLIDSHQFVRDSHWGDSQPSADDENAFLYSHSWDEFAHWHFGLTEGAKDETKARYGLV